MPITCKTPNANLTRDEFVERDDLIMKCAYATQNKLGRLCEERVYENELADRLRAAGMKNVMTQVPILVTHGPFSKEYRIDLVADDAVYELKTVVQYLRAHDTQVFNYAMCLGIRCIKLLNFRETKVDGKLRIVPVTPAKRHACRIITDDWGPLSSRCHLLKENLISIVDDFGGFLEASLYEESLSCLLTAPESRLTVRSNGNERGTHPTRMLTDHIAFYVSAYTDDIDHQRPHLQRLLALLPLKAMHWINFNHQDITLITLTQ